MLMGLLFAASIVAAAADDPARAAAARRVAARHHRLLRRRCSRRSRRCCRRSGRGKRCSRACRADATRCTPARCGRRRSALTVLLGAGVRALALRRVQQGAGGAQGAVHAARDARAAGARCCRSRPVRRHLLVKDLKVFLRDVSQWSQLLLLLALVLVYLYNFRVLDLERIPYMSGMVKNVYAFVNLGDGRSRHGDGRGAVRVPGGVGRGRGVLDHPHRADLARATFSGPSSGPAWCPCSLLTERLTVLANELLGDRSVAEGRLGGGRLLHEPRARRAGDRPRRALSALQRGEPEPGRRIVRRRGVHDPGRALRHHRLRARRLALVALSLASRREACLYPPSTNGRCRSRLQPEPRSVS